MQVTKEGIERVKTANELPAVLAERGISLRKKGRVLVARCPFHEEKTPSFTVTPSKGLFHCFGCGVAGDVIGFVTKYEKVSFGAALDTLARRAGLDLRKLMEERPRMKQRTPVDVLTSPRDADAAGPSKDSSRGAPAAEVLSRVVDHYHRTFCEREDAQAYLVKRGITDTDLVQALKVGYADGSLLKAIPKTGELRKAAARARPHHRAGARAPRRLRRRADPGSSDRPVGEPLRPRAFAPRATATSRAPSAAS